MDGSSGQSWTAIDNPMERISSLVLTLGVSSVDNKFARTCPFGMLAFPLYDKKYHDYIDALYRRRAVVLVGTRR